MAKRKAGRPPKINDEIINLIVQAVQVGNYMEAAAAYAGISRDTLYRWLKHGAREIERVEKELSEGLKPRIKKEDFKYVCLAERLRKATADSEVRDVSMISKAPAGS